MKTEDFDSNFKIYILTSKLVRVNRLPQKATVQHFCILMASSHKNQIS